MTNYLAVLTILIIVFQNYTTAQKYLADIEYIQQCPEPEYAHVETPVTDIKMHKLNRTLRSFSMNLTIKRPWDADVGFAMELDIWAYAGWTHLPYVPLQPDFCKKFKTIFRGTSDQVSQSLHADHPLDCPFQPGRYALINYTSTATTHFPFKGRFRYKVILKSVKTKEAILCLKAIVNVDENV